MSDNGGTIVILIVTNLITLGLLVASIRTTEIWRQLYRDARSRD